MRFGDVTSSDETSKAIPTSANAKPMSNPPMDSIEELARHLSRLYTERTGKTILLTDALPELTTFVSRIREEQDASRLRLATALVKRHVLSEREILDSFAEARKIIAIRSTGLRPRRGEEKP